LDNAKVTITEHQIVDGLLVKVNPVQQDLRRWGTHCDDKGFTGVVDNHAATDRLARDDLRHV
jgi:hypothetical protein